MFTKNKTSFSNKFTLNERFKDDVNSSKLTESSIKRFNEFGFIRTIPSLSLGSVLTLNTINNFKLDMKFNLKSLYEDTRIIKNTFLTNSIRKEKILDSIFREAKEASIELKESYIKQTINYNSIVKINTFTKKDDSLFHVKSLSFLLEDPLTKSTFTKSFSMSKFTDIGLSLPVKNILAIPFINVVKDFSDSEIGHLIIDESDPLEILDGNFYRFSVLKRQTDILKNKYIRKDGYSISLWFEFGGIQVFNFIKTFLSSNLKIDKISYLDQNENEINAPFEASYQQNVVSVFLEKITCKCIKVKFKLQVPDTSTMLNDEFGDVYGFYIRDFVAQYISYDPTGYFLSHPLKVKNLTGAKFRINATLRNKYILSSYLCIEELTNNNKIASVTKIPLLPDYNNLFIAPLYFINNKAKLDFYPSGDVTIYRDGLSLEAGTDYYFYTSKDSTEVNSVPTVNSEFAPELYIKINSFNQNSRYTCSYKPSNSYVYFNKIKLNNDSVSLVKKIKKCNVYTLLILRQKEVDSSVLPFIKSYLIELYYGDQ